ncbi:MAG: hypothetical protein HYX34_04030 [Actinobacteria bacterium]|nr:hypothetical protein [Actinomycetota bacterium]
MAAVLAAVLVLAVGACGSNDPQPRSNPTTTTSPSTTSTSTATSTSTTTTAPADPWAIPDEIDVAYVQRIVTKLQDIGLAAYDDVRKDPSTATDATRRLAATASLRYFAIVSNELAKLMREGFPPQGPIRYVVLRIDRAAAECTVATARAGTRMFAMALVPASQAVTRDRGVNPTPWVLNYVYRADLASPEMVCAPG